MATKTSIVNMALVHLGTAKTIANIETEKSTEATVARTVFDTVFEDFLRAHNWGFARKYAFLGLVSEDTSDSALWNYSYRYPTGCIIIRRIMPDPALLLYPHTIEYPYEISTDDQGKLLLTNVVDVRVEYTSTVDDINRIPADAQIALSYYLAATMAPAVTNGDQFQLGAAAQQKYFAFLEDAKFGSIRGEHSKTPTDDEVSEFTRGRE